MMNNKTTHVQESIRMFIGVEVPDDVREKIQESLNGYTRFTKSLVPEENWHVTVLFMGEVFDYKQCLEALSAVMAQAFIPTLSLTHIGKGLKPQQLWTFAQATPLFGGLQKQLIGRLNSLDIAFKGDNVGSNFVPHIKLGDLRVGSSNNLLADLPMLAVWRVEKLNIYRSELLHAGANYSIVGHINLS